VKKKRSFNLEGFSKMNETTDQNFFQKNKEKLGLGALIVYVLLLGLGTIGEVWEVEWILDLPLFRPPGKY